MRISFDLVDTLICFDPAVPCEPNKVPRLLRPWFTEPLRLGTVRLMQELQQEGWDVWIYTTSLRSPVQVKRWFKFYGIEIAAVVNQTIHDQFTRQSQFQKYVSKYPPAFDIDLHIDDLEVVREEGLEHGFDVVVVHMTDTKWTTPILEAARARAVSRQKFRTE
jgi:hypothetical protein